MKWENISYFYNNTSGCGTEICFYDNRKYNETTAFGNELAIYPVLNEPDEMELYKKFLREDGILDRYVELYSPYYNSMC